MVGRSLDRLIVVLVVAVGLEAFANAGGVVGYSGKNVGTTCSSCHAANTALAAPTVTITGPATLAPGAVGNYVLTITGGPGIRGGMNVAAEGVGAVLQADGATTQASAGEVTHLAARTFSGGAVSFNFRMSSSTAGVVKLYGAGNSCNNAGGSSGDREGLATLDVNVSSGNAAPTIATAAAASPATVTGATTSLSVLGADDNGESALLYTWSATGPAPATFSLNGTNAAKNTVASFSRSGSYTFTVTVRDAASLSVTSTRAVTVQASLASITVSPGTVGLAPGGTQQFATAGVDQFGQALTPTPTWSVSGGGTISTTGLFTAGATPGGPHTVTATAATRTATAQATVSAGSPPTVVQAARAAVSPVSGKTAALSVLGADDGSEAALVYTWAAAQPPAPVTFSANGTNAAKSVTATFTRAGSYPFTVTLRDAVGLSVTSSVTVVVSQTLTAVAVSPANTTVGLAGTAQFMVSGTDQFVAPIATAPSVGWTVAGGGTISPGGLFTAGTTPGGPFAITATSGALTATAQVTISSAAGPSFAQQPSALPTLVLGRSASLKVLAADALGEAALVYHWSSAGPAPVTFGANDTNAAKNTAIAFTRAGIYPITVQVKNAAGLTAQASFELNVDQALSALTLDPLQASVGAGGVQQFRADQLDQFGLPMSTPADVTWTVAGTGMIGADGVFQAPTTSGGPWLVAGSANGVRGTALVTVGSGSGGITPVDTIAPQVTVMNVGAGSQISGAVVVSAQVNDEVGVAQVQLQLDGATIATRSMAPWDFMLDTTGYPNGEHTLELIARDAAGNEGRALKITIEIKNAVSMLGTVSGETELPGCSAGPGALLLALGMLLPLLFRRRSQR